MSTRSKIGIYNEDGTVTSIYCHFDGYPEGVGKVLSKYYQDEATIRKLMELGDLSSLGMEPVDRGWEAVDNPILLCYDSPAKKCQAFGSNPHEDPEDCKAVVSKNIKEYAREARSRDGDYAYLFKDNKWRIAKLCGAGTWRDLKFKK